MDRPGKIGNGTMTGIFIMQVCLIVKCGFVDIDILNAQKSGGRHNKYINFCMSYRFERPCLVFLLKKSSFFRKEMPDFE